MKYFEKHTLLIFTLFLLLNLFIIGPQKVFANDYFECLVNLDTGKSSSCATAQGGGHICQLYQGYDGSGIPEFCSGYCVKRSGVPKECAVVSVQPSNNPEAHEQFVNKLRSKLSFNVNTDFFKEKMRSSSKWWREEIKCEKSVQAPKMGQVLEVKGEGKVWISRGLDEYRAARFAPLLAGDTLVVPEKMSVKIELEGMDNMNVKENTKVIISSGGKRGEQCLKGWLQSGAMNTLGRMWNWANDKLKGEDFEIKRPTVVFGVRG